MVQYLTRTGTLTGVMPKLYISCHPDDYELHFRTLCSDIFAVQENCAIFYEDDPSADYSEEELQENLGEMRLLAVPVTQRLLMQQSRALDKEIPFAVRNSIPILPVLMEEDDSGRLIDTFNNTPVFAGLQFLNRYDKDSTALRYEDKLKVFLKSVLISEEEVKKIHDEFSSKIFLSYRKKDRASAQELMKKIHRVDVCRDTAIWYDEYLIPGESFDTNIMQALEDSDVFVMSVSGAFEEPGNYVADHEYPDAVRKKKPLMAARMKHFNQESLDNLEVLYPGINTLLIDPEDQDSLGVTLRQRLTEDAGIKEDALLNNDGEHLYYIALAYKNGVRTVADPSRAAALFALSAENGCYESYLRVIKMHRMGDGIPKDYDAALECCEKAEKALQPLEGSSVRTDNVLASVYGENGHICSDLQRTDDVLRFYQKEYELRRRMHVMYDDAPVREYCESMISLASVLFGSGRFEEAKAVADGFASDSNLIMENPKESGEGTEDELTMLRIQARMCSLMCAIYIQLKQHTEVLHYAERNIEVCEKIEALTGSPKDLKSLADAYLGYADFVQLHDMHKANLYFDKYNEIQKKVAEYEVERPRTISDAIDMLRIANNTLYRIAEGDTSAPDRAKVLYNEVLEICSGLMDGTSRYSAMLQTVMVHSQFADIERLIQHSNSGALEEYQKALDICRDMDKEFRNDIQVLHQMSGLYDQIGTVYFNAGDLTSATEYYTDALEIDMRASRLKKDPGSLHNLAKSYMRCAEINRERGHQPVADVNYRSALKILEPLIQQTDDYRIIEDYALVLLRLGMSERLKTEQRMEYYNKSAAVYELLMKMTNNAKEYVNNHRFVQTKISEIS